LSSILLAVAAASGCTPAAPRPQAQHAAAEAAPPLRELASPAPAGSRLPRLTTGPGGHVFLSWVEESESDHEAMAQWRFSEFDGSTFAPPRPIAAGAHWVINWVDVPALVWLGGDRWAGHYLERLPSDAHSYHVLAVRSTDGGATWSAPQRLHDHDGGGEHGFPSWVDLGGGTAFAAWLDGRNTSHDGGGAMELLARTVSADGRLGPEIVLDERVCDCCPTAAVRAGDGSVLIAYRDRSDDEVRDITILRWRAGSEPQRIWSSADGWKIPGCPVNGPAVVAEGSRVGVAWFTLGADGEARVLACVSPDGGRSFGAPVVLARGPVQGRVDAAFDAGGSLAVTWLEAEGERGAWKLARLDSSGGAARPESIVATRASRDAGLARLARSGGTLLFAYTAEEGSPRVLVRSVARD
jgi:hypothetical protein